jgi:hypothetical protein
MARASFEDVHSLASADRLPDTVELDLVTVAFNNSHVVSEQIRLMRANLRDAFAHTVVDNSSDRSRSGEIERLCARREVAYIRLPHSSSSAYDPSSSHGRALNWAWRNYILPRSARYFGFLDHDVFPMRPTSLVRYLGDQPVWGHLQTRGSRWYLWPGLCVFDARWLGGRQLDFMPGRGFDVGGRLNELWRTSLSLDSLAWPALSYGRLREAGGVPQDGDTPQDDLYETLGDWLHTINGSGWMPVKSRDQPVADLLRQF